MKLLTAALVLLVTACSGTNADTATTDVDENMNEVAYASDASSSSGTINWAAAPSVAAVGQIAPDFTLTDVAGNQHSLSNYVADGKTVVLEWFNPDCPVTQAYHKKAPVMKSIYGDFKDQDVVWLAVNSGAPGRQGAGTDRNNRAVTEFGIPYPVLMDADGNVGHQYAAKTTPHMFVIDQSGVLQYAGGIEERESGTNYVRQALAEIGKGQSCSVSWSKPFGCSVKYAD